MKESIEVVDIYTVR